MRRIEKMIWSALCSAVLGLGASGCVRSCGQPGDLEEPSTGGGGGAVQEESELDDVYGPPAYGPPPSEVEAKPVVEEESDLDDVYGPPTAPVE